MTRVTLNLIITNAPSLLWSPWQFEMNGGFKIEFNKPVSTHCGVYFSLLVGENDALWCRQEKFGSIIYWGVPQNLQNVSMRIKEEGGWEMRIK